MSALAPFLSYLLLYKYIALFIIVFIAGVVVPLPVNTFLMAVGAFSIQGYFSFPVSFIVALIANILGDFVDYWFFSRYGHALLHEEYAMKYSFFTRLESYVTRHTGVSVFVSRIIGILGPPVNFLVGYLHISFWKFSFFDILGNGVFVFIFLSLGYILGDEWQNITVLLSTISGIVIVLVFFGVLAVMYGKKEN